MLVRRAVASVALLALMAASPAAQAQQSGSRALLEIGRQQYTELRFDEALQTLSAASIRPGNSREAEVQIYELLGLSYLSLNRRDEAEGAFRRVLIRDAAHQLSSDESPRFVEFFQSVRQRWEAEGRPGAPRETATDTSRVAQPQPVVIEHRSPAQQQRGRAVPLRAIVRDPGGRSAGLVLAYRSGQRGLFRRTEATHAGAGRYETAIPAEAVRPPIVEYYLEAVDARGVPVHARGDAYAPLRVAVPEPGGIPWWVFVGGGAVVAAAVVTTFVVVSSQTSTGRLIISISGE